MEEENQKSGEKEKKKENTRDRRSQQDEQRKQNNKGFKRDTLEETITSGFMMNNVFKIRVEISWHLGKGEI